MQPPAYVPAAPVEHEALLDVVHKLASDRLDLVELLGGEDRVGLREQVEHRELGLGQPLSNRALLLLRQLLRERLQPAQHLVDVEAAGVVGVDQRSQPLDERQPGGVAPRGTFDSLGQIGGDPLG